MNIVFAGTPEFAAVALQAIIDAAPGFGWKIRLVLTQPDRPAGRGLKLAPSPVKQIALAHGIEVHTPSSLRKGDDAVAANARLAAVEPDILVVAAYGLILPQAILDIPRGLRPGWQPKLSALNIHASLLPRWRGAAPILRAIEAGDATTGITLMQMDAGLDTGPMLARQSVAIAANDTARTLTGKLAQLGAKMVVDALRNVARQTAAPQSGAATYATKVSKSEAWLDWSQPAVILERRVRAFDPFPVATGSINRTTVRFWRASVIDSQRAGIDEVGCVRSASAAGVQVACGSGDLLITELQRAGGRRVAAREFLTGFAINAGDRFDAAAIASE